MKTNSLHLLYNWPILRPSERQCLQTQKRVYFKVANFVSEVCIHLSLSLVHHESNHRNRPFQAKNKIQIFVSAVSILFFTFYKRYKVLKENVGCNDFNNGVMIRHESSEDDVRSRVMGQSVDRCDQYRSSDLTNCVYISYHCHDYRTNIRY